MARGVRSGDRVIELGAGTGTVTDAILERGVRPEDLFLVEQNAAFASILRHRFPRTTVVQADAADLTTPLRALRGSVDWVISGLPILWFSKEKKTRIVEEAFSLLSAAGGFQQFTYLGRPPVGQRLLTGLGLRAALLGITPLNLPPAFVYRFSRLAA